jgi:Domain of unknown function (DUF4214)
MFHKPRSRRFRWALICLPLLMLALQAPDIQRTQAQSCPDCRTDLENCDGLPGIPLPQPPARSYDDFIVQAYIGAYGAAPSCTQRLSEYNRLVLNSGSHDSLKTEARRFVATLFMTQTSYDSTDPNNYLQTTRYQPLNPQDCDDRPHRRAFVADLYQAFLQREPDQAGHCVWSNEVCLKRVNHNINGRKEVIRAFELSIEFDRLVQGLIDTGPPCCPTVCPRGTFFNPETCSCEDFIGQE